MMAGAIKRLSSGSRRIPGLLAGVHRRRRAGVRRVQRGVCSGLRDRRSADRERAWRTLEDGRIRIDYSGFHDTVQG